MIEYIKILVELWPLVTAIILGLAIITFKKNIANALNRLAKVSYTSDGLHVEFHGSENQTTKISNQTIFFKLLSRINYNKVLNYTSEFIGLSIFASIIYSLGVLHNPDYFIKKEILNIQKKIVYNGEAPKSIIFNLNNNQTKLINELLFANLAEAHSIILSDKGQINKQNKSGFSPLHIAADNGYDNIVKLLLDNDANPNIKDINGKDPLQLAVNSGHTNIVKMLLLKGADVHARCKFGCSPLYNAVSAGSYDIVKLLVDKRIHVNEHKESFSVLMMAVEKEYYDIVKLLLTKAIDIDFSTKDGNTALLYSTNKRDIRITKILLENNANPDIVNDEGQSALIVAVMNNNINLVKLLLQYKADKNYKDLNGKVALDYAIEKQYDKIRILLESSK